MPSNPLGDTWPLVPPLFQSSVYTLPDLDALDRVMNDGEPGFIYARDAHPNARQLAARLADIEGALWGLVTSSGMSAISAIVLATVQQGQRIAASNHLYGRTTQLLGQELQRFGVETTFIDTGDLAKVEEALKTPTRLLLVETLSNPMLRAADIPELAKLARTANTMLVVDNTFATPALTRPVELGAHFVMESLTKMIGGHSDITLGLVCGNDPDRLMELSAASSIWGLSSNPFDCWLALRGLDTLAMRVQASCDNALSLARWLRTQPGVARVVYPGLEDHPDHALTARLLGGQFGHMLCFDLAGGRDAVNRFMRTAPGIPFSPSLGNTTTTCSHPSTTSHRYVNPPEKARLGITDGLIRLSVGVEPVAAIMAEMSKGL